MSRHITHIGVIVHDLDGAVRLWEDSYGFKLTHRIDIEAERIRSAMLSPNGRHGEMGVELIEPMDKDDMANPIARRLAQAGEGFYHIGLVIDDTAATARALQAQGKTVIERPPAAVGAALSGVIDPAACRQIVHPRHSNGILVEMLQSA
ncbi:MAG: VOC family protein [Nevskia sp.]|nr:VOC family protein [Nevskia sp.]